MSRGGGGGGFNGNGAGAATITNGSALTGGNGGAGAANGGADIGGGGGGAGGYGAIVTGGGASSNTSTISGGAGGTGDNTTAALDDGGGGGDGGVGVQFTASGATLTNSGTIAGGGGGARGTSPGPGSNGAHGAGGAGIVGSGLTVINSNAISGGLSGDGVTRANAITFTGGTNVLELQAGSAITGNVVAFSASDTLRLGGTSNASFDVSQIGAAAQYRTFGVFQKAGTSIWTLTGTNTATLPWTINAGTLSVTGTIANSTVTVNSGGTLGGTGNVGAVTVNSGGTLGPGLSPGIINTGNLTLNSGSTLTIEANGAFTPGADYDQVNVIGTVTLGNATLSVVLGFAPQPGDVLTIINNAGTGPVSGTFNGLAEGGVVTIAGVGRFTISYVGGDGNDVTLTALAVDATWLANPGSNDFNTASNWTPAVVPTGTATFGASSITSLVLSQPTSVNTLQFNAGAPAYTFNLSGNSLSLGGSGVVNSSSNAPTITSTLSALRFTSSATAGNAVIQNAPGLVQFFDSSTAGSAAITNSANGLVTFSDATTAGSATITTTDSGVIFNDNSTAGNAQLVTNGGAGSVDLSGTLGPNNDGKFSAGSMAGSGTYKLGGGQLTVGSNGLSTTVSGVIVDGGNGGGTGASLVKTGSGTLTLSGTNTYTGATTVNAGTLAVTGSITSAVTVSSGGTLAGTGTINNTVALTSGGTLGPGLSVGTLSTGSVTFVSGAVFAVEIDGTGSDRLNVTGAVTLSGATLSLSLLGGYVHTTGTVYTIVNNDGTSDPVAGTFSGLSEGATVTAGGRTFRISYVGGDGNDVTLTATAATRFSVSAPASATAGSTFSFTVTALDQFNGTATGYSGTVHFTSTDGQAVLPADSTLTNGTGTFSATLKTAGSRTITGTDTVTASINGTSNSIAVSAAVTGLHYTIGAPASATAGTAFSFTVTARDQFNNTVTGYSGTVHFTSSDPQAILPANATLTNGTGSFNATLKTVGSQTLTATDTVTASITGTSNTIAVSAAAATHFSISAPPSATPNTAGVAGTAFSFTVTALDQFNNVATGYTGTLHFTSSDPQATLPADSTLTNGTGTFSATLRTAGSQTITARDTVNASIAGTSNAIVVSPAAATRFTLSAPAAVAPGETFSFTVTARDQFNNVATGYTGTVHFTSSDSQATLPADAPLTNGVGTFNATLRTPGSQTLTATDTVNSAITGSAAIIVGVAPIPTLSTWAFLLLAMLLAALALRAIHRRPTF